jgi:leucine dehydrogenase
LVDLWGGEQLVLCRDDDVGLRAIIAIDDTTLGPGLGGVRLRAYPSEAAAIRECRRLAAVMTLKNALAQLPYGGAKSVIIDTGAATGRDALMRRFGAFVARTGGAYIPGVDMGTTVRDLATIAEAGPETSCSQEDPSPWTALGVAAAVQAAVEHVDARTGVDGVRVLVQGAGHVGAALARALASRGAAILVADVDGERAATLARELGATVVACEAALTTPCDVLAPCAVARVVSPETVGRLGCRIIAGAANDTLAERGCAEVLAACGITYVPDFVANAGGVIHIHALRHGFIEQRLRDDVLRIGHRVGELLTEADALGRTPLAVAEASARRAIARARSGEEAIAA